MWARRTGILMALLVLAAWSASLAAGRPIHKYYVYYHGHGDFHSTTESLAGNDCGNITTTRVESTDFSWNEVFHLTLSFGRHDVYTGGDSSTPHSDDDYSNTSTITLNETGCEQGEADCYKGNVEPVDDDVDMDVFGSGKLTADAVPRTGFTADDFIGYTSPSLSPFTCSQLDHLTVLSPYFDPGDLFHASFPVKYSTWKSLTVGHYFQVHISPGHYAPSPNYNCEKDDGCDKENVDWSGIVKVKRVS